MLSKIRSAQLRQLNILIKYDQTFLKYSTNQNDYQFIQKSDIPTLHFQKSLPKLPIPELESTCKRYLKAVRPLLNDDQFKTTERIVETFQKHDGSQLQKHLLDYSQKINSSYISEAWSEMYLKDRRPLPINYNPFLIHNDFTNNDYNAQALKATNLLISTLRFMRSLRQNILKPEIYFMDAKTESNNMFRLLVKTLPKSLSWYGAYLFKAYPLDMVQYDYLFNTTRIPKKRQDVIHQDKTKKHILVLKGGNFYVFDVLDNEGNIIAPNIIYANILNVLKNSKPIAEYPLSILTTEDRTNWSQIRSQIEETSLNKESLNQIDSALFCLILDDEVVRANDKTKMLRHFLHSDGKNRWFDKSISIIVTRDAVSGVNFEHAWGDGVAVLRLINDIYNDANQSPFVHPNTEPINDNNYPVKSLKFNFDNLIINRIKESESNYKNWYSSLDINYILYDGIGKNLCKQNSVSPDAVMQLAFQVAYYQQHKTFVGTYESCSTAAFKNGRTETIRPCTIETKKFCEKLDNADMKSLKSQIKTCSDIHNQLTKNAAMGQGFDRHLFALQYIANKNKLPIPELYNDEAYKLINYNVLSTSTLSSPYLQGGGFGPVVKDGYGIGYSIKNDELGVVVTSYKNQQNGKEFVELLKNSFEKIKNILKS